MKRCSRCRELKRISDFGAASREKDGLRPECRECRKADAAQSADRNRARANAWYAANKDRRRAYNESHREQRRVWERAWTAENRQRQEAKKAWYKEHKAEIIARNREKFKTDPEKKYAYMREWHKTRPGYNREHVKKWARKYPDRAKALETKMAARRREAPGEVTEGQWQQILAFYEHRCIRCHTPATERALGMDHYIPIARGGHHEGMNIQPLCRSCNSSKNSRMPTAPAPPHALAFLLEAS